MKNLAIIPARGGSKRIPRKNVKEFCGKPIMAYPIEAALKSGIFDEVMVSTDDEEIAAIARQYGASVPFMRSEATANDYASISAVVVEVLQEYEKRGRKFDYAYCLYSTSPFVNPQILQNVQKQLAENPDANGTVVMVPYNYPPQRARYADETGNVFFLYPEYAEYRSQDLVHCFNDAAICFANKADMYLGHTPWGPRNLAYEIHPMYAQDIDNEEDWEMMEFKYQYLKSKGKV